MKVVAKITKIIHGGRGRELQRKRNMSTLIPLILWGIMIPYWQLYQYPSLFNYAYMYMYMYMYV